MGLQEYRKKRSFDKTPEPTGGKANDKQLRFVVQEHAASRLHYDFRLEMGGVLKSWAVPKGPSTDPAVKRLAMQVEDHPYSYRDFEGTIPEGNYGAGTVIVWDQGFYTPLESSGSKQAQNRALLKQLREGSLKFRLSGEKLKGEFALVKTKQSENSWLLIKHRDEYASASDITSKNKSVLSGKTLKAVAKDAKAADKKETKTTKTKSSPSTPRKQSVKKNTAAKGTKKRFPINFKPMLATLSDPFDAEGWLYEIKWDGYRAVSLINGNKTELVSRNNKSFREKFYPIFDAVQKWPIKAIVDGEIVVLNEQGRSDFGALQNWRSEADGALVYYVFDILWLNGYDLTELPLAERRKILEEQIKSAGKEGIIRLSEAFSTDASSLLAAAAKLGFEGIMAKREESRYIPGERSRDWLKMKIGQRHEVVIGGYTRNEGSGKAFSSLLVGVHDNGKLIYTGKIGTGFSDAQQKEMLKSFQPLIRKTSPFSQEPDINKPSRFRPVPPHAEATWLNPELVCEVSYTEITADGLMRHPSFEGMRTDKTGNEVVREKAIPANPSRKPKILKNSIMPAKQNRKTLLNPSEKQQVKKFGKAELTFSNLDKLFWPKEKITKRDLLNYYYRVAPYMLPYLKNRPHSLNRHPNGYAGKSFYQKDVTDLIPDWIKRFPYKSQDDNSQKNFLVCTDEASLLYMVNLGCIEINPWSSTIAKPDNPDWCILDLDPDKKKGSFEEVIEAARVAHQIMESAGIPSFCKTSGSTGLHIYIPLNARYTYEESKEFARLIVALVQQELPETTTIERVVSKRGGRIYLDFLQNRPQATLAAPYSVRPKPGATVSMPLHWEEVKPGLKTQDFTLNNVIPLLEERGDLFSPVLGKGVDIQKALKALSSLSDEDAHEPEETESKSLHQKTKDMAKYSKRAGEKVEKVMREMKEGKLKSGSGKKVTSRQQAVAIGLSEARKEGAKVPRKKTAKKAAKKTARKTAPQKTLKKSAAKKTARKTPAKKTLKRSTARKTSKKTAAKKTARKKTASKR